MMSSSQNFNSLKLDEILGNVLATYKEYKPTIDECIEKYVTKDQNSGTITTRNPLKQEAKNYMKNINLWIFPCQKNVHDKTLYHKLLLSYSP